VPARLSGKVRGEKVKRWEANEVKRLEVEFFFMNRRKKLSGVFTGLGGVNFDIGRTAFVSDFEIGRAPLG
jgi:hypothetical protein